MHALSRKKCMHCRTKAVIYRGKKYPHEYKKETQKHLHFRVTISVACSNLARLAVASTTLVPNAVFLYPASEAALKIVCAFVFVCVYVCKCTCMCVCQHVYTYAHINTSHTLTHTYTHTYTQAHTHAHTYTPTYKYSCICVQALRQTA